MDPTFTALAAEFGGSSGNMDEKLLAVNAEIERARNRLSGLQSYASNLKSAINRMRSLILALPDEIVSQIFYWSSLEAEKSNDFRTRTRPSIPNLVAAASVCRRWRSICHSTTILWRHFDWKVQGLRRDEYFLRHYLERCIRLSGPSSIDLSVSFTLQVAWDVDVYHSFLGRHASKISHFALTLPFQKHLLKHPMPNLRSLSLQTVPFLFTSLSSFFTHFPTLAALEISTLPCHADDHAWDVEISDAIAHYDPYFQSPCPIRKLTISRTTDSIAIVLMRPIGHTLVHLYLGPISRPMMESTYQADRRRVMKMATSQDIFLPFLETLDIDIDLPRLNTHPRLSLYERLHCGRLRRVRCLTSMVGSPNKRDAKQVWVSRKGVIDVLLWAIRRLVPLSTTDPRTVPHIPTSGLRPHPYSTPRLLVLENKHFPQSVADEISSVSQSSDEGLVFVSCRGQAVTFGPPNSKIRPLPPALDLDMNNGSVLPSPEDPFWENNIEAIIRFPGQPSTVQSRAGEEEGGIPARLLLEYEVGDLEKFFKGDK